MVFFQSKFFLLLETFGASPPAQLWFTGTAFLVLGGKKSKYFVFGVNHSRGIDFVPEAKNPKPHQVKSPGSLWDDFCCSCSNNSGSTGFSFLPITDFPTLLWLQQHSPATHREQSSQKSNLLPKKLVTSDPEEGQPPQRPECHSLIPRGKTWKCSIPWICCLTHTLFPSQTNLVSILMRNFLIECH